MTVSPEISLSAPQSRARRLSFLAFLFLIIGSVGLDQVTKLSAHDHLMVWEDAGDVRQYRGEVFPLFSLNGKHYVEGETGLNFVLNLNYVRNQGAAWGVFSSWADAVRVPFFYGVTFAAVLLIFFYLHTTPLGHRLARFALVLVLSGALGNLSDRLLRGYVIDFIDVRWSLPLFNSSWHYNFPNFNWADSCISVGVFLLFVDMLILENLRKKSKMPIPM